MIKYILSNFIKNSEHNKTYNELEKRGAIIIGR